jgi:hypothetical protein
MLAGGEPLPDSSVTGSMPIIREDLSEAVPEQRPGGAGKGVRS